MFSRLLYYLNSFISPFVAGSHLLHLSAYYEPAWNSAEVALAWEGYSEALLRSVAGNTLKPRQKLSAQELREKLLTWHTNPPQVDRRLRDLSATARTLLALMHIGKRTQWRVGTLLELISCLHGQGADTLAVDGLKVIEELFEQGMLIPVANGTKKKLASFEDWLGQGPMHQFLVWAPPEILARVAGDFGVLPDVETVSTEVTGTAKASDGLEWFLRLGVVWQNMHDSPARLTQQGAFFKRDQDRLNEDVLLNQPLHDQPVAIPQMGHFATSLGLALGVLQLSELQVFRGKFPDSWQHGWKPALIHLMGVLSDLSSWSVSEGWRGLGAGTNPWPSSTILILSLLARLDVEAWTTPALLADWLARNHCYWSPREFPPDLTGEVETLVLGILMPLRLIETAKVDETKQAVRLTALGRALLSEKGDVLLPEFPKTLLIQPNLEMVAYRQGLNPRMVAELSQCATWKTLGAACMLSIDQHSVHRGMDAGASFESLSKLFDQHCVHPPPGNVIEALRTWSAKRDRLAVYQGVNLLEFLTKADLDEALARGMKGVALDERYLLIENEEDLDYRHFRTLGTRDYTLPPTQCVTIAEDGVTLTVDPTRADLLLETELLRFTVPSVVNETRQYKMTFATLEQARRQGLSLRFLEDWFIQRTGQPISMAGKLLWSDRSGVTLGLEPVLIVRASNETQADGLWQWPETRALLSERLGPSVFLIESIHIPALRNKLAEIDLTLVGETGLEIKASA